MKIERITLDMIEARIASSTYEIRADGRTTVCELTFNNGWTERGEATCNLLEDFNAEKGRAAARSDAIRKAWPHFTFLAREQAFRAVHGGAALVEKKAPVQGYTPGIPWSMHLEAYDAYCARYSPQEALITGGCRGGFHTSELDIFIPGWRDRVSEIGALKARVAELEAQVVAATTAPSKLALDAVRMLQGYAESYDTMARVSEDGEVRCRSVAHDIRANMIGWFGKQSTAAQVMLCVSPTSRAAMDERAAK